MREETVTIRCKGQVYCLKVKEGAPLLLEAVSRSVPIPFYCTTGRCGTCVVRVLEGEGNVTPVSEHEAYRLGERVKSGFRLACRLFVYGDVTVEVPGENN
jgi:ferredoxin